MEPTQLCDQQVPAPVAHDDTFPPALCVPQVWECVRSCRPPPTGSMQSPVSASRSEVLIYDTSPACQQIGSDSGQLTSFSAR